ncbi:RPS13A [Symbiodinium sp. CCMP2592]|nr:RPS13A [Symbiodinium sp. CCMP2592]
MKPEDVCDHICKLAKKGLTPSQIGVTLRDSFGVPQVKNVTGNHILRILKTNGLAPTLPEDLYYLIKKAVSIRKHLDKNRKDKDAKFRLILVESRIHRLARYYKRPHLSLVTARCIRVFGPVKVFYSKFRASAPNYRPLLSLLNKRVEVNETYAATLEEIEGFFVHLRLRLLTLPVSSQLQSIVHGELALSQLAPATRQASTYILEIAQLEKQCFEAYFELRHQQEVYRLADVCVLGVVYRLHKDVQEKLIYRVEMYIREEIKGYVLGSSDLDYPSILYGSGTDTPHQETAMGQFQRGWYPTLPRTLSILAKIYRVLEMSTFQGLAQEAVDLCMRSLKEASEYLSRRSLPSCDASLQVFQPLVQMMDSQLFLVKHLLLLREQVAAFECELAWGPDGSFRVVLSRAQQGRALLQVVSEKYFNFANVWEALNLKLPDGILGILKPTVYHAEVDSKKDIESELKAACEALITNVTARAPESCLAVSRQLMGTNWDRFLSQLSQAHITQPLAVRFSSWPDVQLRSAPRRSQAVNTKIGQFLASPGVSQLEEREPARRASHRLKPSPSGGPVSTQGRSMTREIWRCQSGWYDEDQGFMQPDELRDVIGAFMANVKAKVPFTAAHIRLYLSAAPEGLDRPILWKPVEMRLVDTWGRLEGLLEEGEQGTSLETLGFPRPEPLRELIAALFNAVMEEPWENVVQMVSQVPRRNFSADVAQALPVAASQGSLGQPEAAAPAPEPAEAPPRAKVPEAADPAPAAEDADAATAAASCLKKALS